MIFLHRAVSQEGTFLAVFQRDSQFLEVGARLDPWDQEEARAQTLAGDNYKRYKKKSQVEL